MRIIRIKNCYDCPFYTWRAQDGTPGMMMRCNHRRRPSSSLVPQVFRIPKRFWSGDITPEWCPLEKI